MLVCAICLSIKALCLVSETLEENLELFKRDIWVVVTDFVLSVWINVGADLPSAAPWLLLFFQYIWLASLWFASIFLHKVHNSLRYNVMIDKYELFYLHEKVMYTCFYTLFILWLMGLLMLIEFNVYYKSTVVSVNWCLESRLGKDNNHPHMQSGFAFHMLHKIWEQLTWLEKKYLLVVRTISIHC